MLEHLQSDSICHASAITLILSPLLAEIVTISWRIVTGNWTRRVCAEGEEKTFMDGASSGGGARRACSIGENASGSRLLDTAVWQDIWIEWLEYAMTVCAGDVLEEVGCGDGKEGERDLEGGKVRLG